MMNTPNNSTGYFDELSLPQFVQKLTADSVTPSRMSAGNENYGAYSSSQPSSSNIDTTNPVSMLDSANAPLPGYANFSGNRLFSRSLSLNDASYSGNMMPQVMTASSTSGINVKREPGYELMTEDSDRAFEQMSEDSEMQSSVKIKEESSIQPADSNSPKQPFVPCKVCGDRASGYHYGVTSCEGCKGFFRRSIQKQIEYRCLRDGKCMVIRLNRNRCQYCRFKKCLAVGMSRDSVRFGRVPKRSKSMDEQCVSSTDPSLDQNALENKQLAIYDVILNVSQAHHAHCAVTEDKLKCLQRRNATLMTKIDIPETPVQFSDEELENQRILMWQCYAQLTTPAVQSVVEFVKRVPGITELAQDDQLILIKSGFFEIWITRMCRMFNREENVVIFEDGSVIQRDELAVVYTPEFVTALFDVAASINQLNLNDTEIGLLTAVILATPDRRGVTDVKGIENLWEKLIEALKLQLKRNHSTEENLFGTTLVKLSELRALSSQHNELLQYYRTNWHRCNNPPLVAEIYDIPKNTLLHQMNAGQV